MAVDYYKVLGLERSATSDAVKAAYRKLARKYHPDLNPNDTEAKRKFQEINEANEVLGDPESRKKYDAYGEHWKHADQYEQARKEQGARGDGSHRGGEQFTGGAGEEDFSDLFGSMFRGRGGQGKFRGQDYHAELQLDLLAAYRTHKQTLTVNGKQIRMTVPAGVENGQTIRIGGHGGTGSNGGPGGDLYITFRIADHPRYKRVGSDLHTTVDLDLYTALLGGELMLETLDGSVKLTAKPETQNGMKVRLKGKGFPVYKHEDRHGDLIVTFNVKLPTGLSEKQRELLRELQGATP
ncbi:MAG: J domain-containing protein [Flavobacteriales bacterium]